MKDKKRSAAKMVSARDNNIAKREKKRATQNKMNRIAEGIMTLGGSEVARKLVKSGTGQKIIKSAKKGIKGTFNKGRDIGKKINKRLGNEGGLINRFKKVPSDAMATGGAYKRQRDKAGNYRPVVKGSSFKMKGFSGFGNESPAKQKFDPYKKDNEAYDKARKKSDDLAQKIATRPHRTPKAKTDKMMADWNKGLKKLDTSLKDIQKKNESYHAYMRKVKSIKKRPSKKGKIKPTPKAKPTTTQKIKNFLGL